MWKLFSHGLQILDIGIASYAASKLTEAVADAVYDKLKNKNKNMKIEKKTYKIAMILMIIVFAFFCCIVAVQNPEKYTFILLPSKYLVLTFSILGILVMPYLFVYLYRLLLSKSSYFVINENGIYNGLSFLEEKNILWKEVVAIDTVKYQGIFRIRIKMKDYNIYLNKLNFFSKYIAEETIKEMGTPILIDNVYLKSDFIDLSNMIFKYWEEYKTRVHPRSPKFATSEQINKENAN